MDRDRNGQTATFNCEISTVWETEARTAPEKSSRPSLRPEKVTKLKPYKLCYDDDNEDEDDDDMSTYSTLVVFIFFVSHLTIVIK